MVEPVHIPEMVRSAALSRLEQYGVTSMELGEAFLMGEGYGSFEDYIQVIEERYGPDEAERVRARMRELAEKDAQGLARGGNLGAAYREQVLANNLPRYALIAGPDAEFLKGIDYGLERIGHLYAEVGTGRGYEAGQDAVLHLDELFAKRGVPYRFEDMKSVWAGDRGLHDVVVTPALQALADPRLAGARNEFEAALAHLRAGTQKEREDAIEEAGKSVESAMKVLADETGTTLPANPTARPMFAALVQAGCLPDYTENLIQAAARIRNKTGGHGAGAQPRQIDLDIATACVNAAASALVLLAGRLP